METEERLSAYFKASPAAADQWEKGAKAVREEASGSGAQAVLAD